MRRLLQWRPRPLAKGEVYAILTGVAIVALPALMYTLIQKNYGCDWTGFGQCPITDNTRGEKTLWDWMDLLLVPLVLAIGGFIYNWTEKRTEQRIAQKRAENDRAIAERHAQDTALQTYLDQMTELLLEYNLREPEAKAEVRDVARVRTLTTLRRLDAVRRNILMRFLRDSKLISANAEEAIIDVRNVDLSRVDLQFIDLSRANLSHANLRDAILSEARLMGANLNGADLSRAIMPDGSTYQPPDSTPAPAENIQQADAPTAAESAPDTRQD